MLTRERQRESSLTNRDKENLSTNSELEISVHIIAFDVRLNYTEEISRRYFRVQTGNHFSNESLIVITYRPFFPERLVFSRYSCFFFFLKVVSGSLGFGMGWEC